MSVRRYQSSLNRYQNMLLPPRVEDYVHQNNTVRAIDAYVNTLDLQALDFKHTHATQSSGQPAYDPAALLKLYLYGYMQGIRSSRKLERETVRNLEVIWLVEGITPSYKTIADFRKDNSAAIKSTNRDFVLLCKELSLLGGEQVAVDGSYFKADTNKDNIYTENKLKKQLTALGNKIADYQAALAKQDNEDDQTGKGSLGEDKQLAVKLERLQAKQAEKKALQRQLESSSEKQISTVDRDARLLTKNGQTTAGYNVQIAVDSQHKLIVAEDTTQDGNDTHQLAPMLEKAQQVLNSDNLEGLADSGYHNSAQIKSCEDEGIAIYVASKTATSKASNQGCFARKDFRFDKENDVYHCPQGNQLTRRENPQVIAGKTFHCYRSSATVCNECPLRKQCLSDKGQNKQLLRWEHEAFIEQHDNRMKQNPKKMRQRSAVVEHPFGTLKHRAGINHFLMRGLKKCGGEFSLMVLAYNFTRVINILGINSIRDYCAQRPEISLENTQYP